MSFDHNQTDILYFNEIADGNLMHNKWWINTNG